MRVLIVDDSVYSIALIGLIVKRKGHEVVGETKNGEEAAAMIKELKPDIVTLDNMLNDIDGTDVLAKLEGDFNPNQFIVISGSYEESVLAEYKKFGITRFLKKPFEPQELEEALEKAAGSLLTK
ncbi:response regulator [Reichenbachiella ulvae]|uniref:Response regulator n=1 Tax=Reichenbachiella ulvae TaxID=2980104 RepID=A0ABT3D0M9_9BACT|nr:response regulator [Reichenbachiella ulvae]MCV9389447.1 response regulator [Reichenbachiella ulvae]